MVQEQFSDEWTALAFTATGPGGCRQVCRCPVPIQQFSSEDCSTHPATRDWTAAPTAQATEQVGTTHRVVLGCSSTDSWADNVNKVDKKISLKNYIPELDSVRYVYIYIYIYVYNMNVFG